MQVLIRNMGRYRLPLLAACAGHAPVRRSRSLWGIHSAADLDKAKGAARRGRR